jgi:hypothetical protein
MKIHQDTAGSPPDSTVYKPGARTTWLIRVMMMFWALAPFGLMLAPPGTQHPLGLVLGSAFSWLMALVAYGGARRMKHSMITMGPQSFTYALPPSSLWRNPFSMNSGTVRYDAIKSVEIRQEWLKAKGIKAWYTSVFVDHDGAPRETLARSSAGDHTWVNDFARDVAARANVALIDRGEFNAQYNGLNHPW